MQSRAISRRDFLKLCSLFIGGLALPRDLAATFFRSDAQGSNASFIPHIYFQWQNEFLSKIIYPMREVKLRDFLTFYEEVDVWAEYKNKNINDLTDEVDAYKKAWEIIAADAQKEYNSLRNYFLKGDVRSDYSNFQQIDEEELAQINHLHAIFTLTWPKDIRGEPSFVVSMRTQWKHRCSRIGDWIKSRDRRHDAMDPAHPKYVPEGEELEFKETVTLPMAEQEMNKLDEFLATYEKIEERKLAWYKLKKSDPAFNISEEKFVETFPAERKVTVRDIVRWKIEEYKKSIAEKDQYQLLDLIHQRFQKEPERFPAWLQYMVVHFSGMRYASAHGSWADPKDLLVRLQVPVIEAQVDQLDDAAIAKMCADKLAAYESKTISIRPKLADAQEEAWKDRLRWYLPNLKSNGPKTRRSGLIDLLKTENAYEFMSKSSQEALDILLSMKESFHPWIWHEIVRLTDLRVTEVSDLHWEILTPKQVAEELSNSDKDLRPIIHAWERLHQAAWRDEHGRTLELIVTRAVCNEAAEHCQHVRGNLPPGGLTPKPKWYIDYERAGDLPGAYFVRPTSEKDYAQGASIFWLRFSNDRPDAWQIARSIVTKERVGLLPTEFLKRRSKEQGVWIYDIGEDITRTRTTILPDRERQVEFQWLRWIHEATVAEVAETVDGKVVITFETALPDDDSDTSSVGIHKMPLSWHLADGSEDQYNRSFVGYVPEGEVSADSLKPMLDWKRILNEQV